MKKIILFATAIMMAGCGFMQNSTSSNAQSSNVQSNNVQSTSTTTAQSGNTALNAGKTAGSSLQALYAQYVADGKKYDYKNLQNIANTVNLIASCDGLKDNYKDKTYLKEFGKGMVASSLGLITQDNVDQVTNSLVDMVKNSETVQNASSSVQQGANTAAGYANTAAQYAGALSTILGAFGGK